MEAGTRQACDAGGGVPPMDRAAVHQRNGEPSVPAGARTAAHLCGAGLHSAGHARHAGAHAQLCWRYVEAAQERHHGLTKLIRNKRPAVPVPQALTVSILYGSLCVYGIC